MAIKNISNQGPAAARVGDAASTQKTAGISDAAKANNGAATTQTNAKGVDVAVSDKAKIRAAEQKRAKELAMKSPEVREDRVAELKAKIADGSYKVDSDKIANGMMREAIMDHLTSEPNR